jgi:hypothetical protein
MDSAPLVDFPLVVTLLGQNWSILLSDTHELLRPLPMIHNL